MKGKFTNICRSVFLFSVFFLTTKVNAQENVPGRIPEYSVPYELPTVDGIKDVLTRIRTYYESTSPQKIIDNQTNKEITDFSKLNKNAQVSVRLFE